MSFADTLIQTARSRPLEENRFLSSIKEGLYPRSALKIFAIRFARQVQNFPSHLAKIISLCPDLQSRAHIMRNLLEEEGMSYSPKTGSLELNPGQNHLNMFKKFGRALGIDEDSLSTLKWNKKNAWIEAAFAKGQWLGPAAFIMVGSEANSPRYCSLLVPAFKKHYGLTKDDIIFFIEHITADEIHGRVGAEMLAKAAQSPKEKELVLEGVKRGAQARWVFHELCDRDMRRQMASSPSLY